MNATQSPTADVRNARAILLLALGALAGSTAAILAGPRGPRTDPSAPTSPDLRPFVQWQGGQLGDRDRRIDELNRALGAALADRAHAWRWYEIARRAAAKNGTPDVWPGPIVSTVYPAAGVVDPHEPEQIPPPRTPFPTKPENPPEE